MRVRARYSKLGKVRFTSHRDGARLWERALRIVAFPVAYTEGFTPRPRLSFGLALPTGAESIAEYIDIALVEGADVDGTDPHVVEELSAALPVGIDVQVIAPVEQPGPAKPPSLQDAVTSTTWELSGPGIDPSQLESTAHRLLAANELLLERERKGRHTVDDVRGLIRHLGADVTQSRLVAELVTVGRGLRPAELASLAFTDVAPADIRVLRTHQWIEHDDDRREVLSLPVGVDALAGGLSA